MHSLIRILRPALLAWASVGLLASPVWAEEQTFRGTLDGEDRVWTILQRGPESTANFHEPMSGMLQVTIQGHHGQRFSVQGAVVISFMSLNEQIGDVEVMYFPESAMLPHYVSSEPTGLEIEKLDMMEDSARITGSYRGTLHFMEAFGATPDPLRSIDLEVTFDVTAARE